MSFLILITLLVVLACVLSYTIGYYRGKSCKLED